MAKNTETVDNTIYVMANQIARSTIAVIDTLVQRGAFKGEELTTIGQLRDQSLQCIRHVEDHNSNKAAAAES